MLRQLSFCGGEEGKEKKSGRISEIQSGTVLSLAVKDYLVNKTMREACQLQSTAFRNSSFLG